jgi:hypothetical protein
MPRNFRVRVWSRIDSRERPRPEQAPVWLEALRSALATPQWVAAALALALLAGWSLGHIARSSGASATETRVAAFVTGEVIDMSCYFDQGASGPDHAGCARRCIASGLPVGLKATDGEVYVLIGKQLSPNRPLAAKRESLNAQLALRAAKIVTVTGTMVRKQGVNVIENARVVSG